MNYVHLSISFSNIIIIHCIIIAFFAEIFRCLSMCWFCRHLPLKFSGCYCFRSGKSFRSLIAESIQWMVCRIPNGYPENFGLTYFIHANKKNFEEEIRQKSYDDIFCGVEVVEMLSIIFSSTSIFSIVSSTFSKIWGISGDGFISIISPRFGSTFIWSGLTIVSPSTCIYY